MNAPLQKTDAQRIEAIADAPSPAVVVAQEFVACLVDGDVDRASALVSDDLSVLGRPGSPDFGHRIVEWLTAAGGVELVSLQTSVAVTLPFLPCEGVARVFGPSASASDLLAVATLDGQGEESARLGLGVLVDRSGPAARVRAVFDPGAYSDLLSDD